MNLTTRIRISPSGIFLKFNWYVCIFQREWRWRYNSQTNHKNFLKLVLLHFLHRFTMALHQHITQLSLLFCSYVIQWVSFSSLAQSGCSSKVFHQEMLFFVLSPNIIEIPTCCLQPYLWRGSPLEDTGRQLSLESHEPRLKNPAGTTMGWGQPSYTHK